MTFDTDWKPGAMMSWIERGVRVSDPAQVVLEADPPRRLAYTWHTLTPEWADAHGFEAQLQQRLAAERRTHVTFEIEPTDDLVKLTVVHADFEPDGALLSMCEEGWPRVLAGLKTLLETDSELEPQGPSTEPVSVA